MSNRLLLAASFAALSLTALAPSDAAAQSDVVRTSDGSFVRGTIVERVEGSHVTLQTVGGELRRFDLREVSYAGPDQMQVQAQTPMQAPMPAPPSAEGHELTITTRIPGLILQNLSGYAAGTVWGYRGSGYARIRSYDAVCGAPCTARVPTGTHVMGVSYGAGDVAGAGNVLIDRPMHLELDYIGREPARIAGWIVFIGSAVACLAAVSVPLFTNDLQDWEVPLGIGMGVLGVGMAVGIPLLAWNDSGIVRVLE